MRKEIIKIITISLLFMNLYSAAQQAIDTNTILIQAAKVGNLELVKLALENNAQIDARDPQYGSAAIHWATYNGHENVVKFLVTRGQVDIQGWNGNTALHFAIEQAHTKIIEVLLLGKADYKIKNNAAISALELGINKDIIIKNLFILAASFYGDFIATELLLKAGAEVNAKNQTQSTPIHLAAYNGHTHVIELLLKAGADVNAKNQTQGTPIHLAAQNGHAHVVVQLLKAGAEVSAKNQTQSTPIHSAAYNGHTHVVELLLKAGADVNAKTQDQGTPLHYAAQNGHTHVVELLLKAGADVNAKNQYQVTPLLYAAENGPAHVVEQLLRAGAEVNAKNQKQSTPLHCAAQNGHANVADLLLKAGAEVNAKNQKQGTPLHYAAQNGHAHVADLLLKAGADINAKSQYQWTPLYSAAQNGHAHVADLLLKAGAEVNSRAQSNNPDFNELFLKCLTLLNKPQTIPLLLEYGANSSDDRDLGYIRQLLKLTGDPNRCLITLALQDKYRLVDTLLKEQPSTQDIDKVAAGKTALMWAAARGEYKIVANILDYAAQRRRDLNNNRPFINNKFVVGAFKLAQDHKNLAVAKKVYEYLQTARDSYKKLFSNRAIDGKRYSVYPSYLVDCLTDFVYGKFVFTDDEDDAKQPKKKKRKS